MEQIIVQEHELVARLFLPSECKEPVPLVITLGGFRGGVSLHRAEKLVSYGFASLALAYFGCAKLPQSLQKIPLEYCERAIDWARAHPRVDSCRIALWGVSRGAELSLLLGSIIPEKIQAIAATMPASALYGAIQTDAPAWVYRGHPLAPNAPFPALRLHPSQGRKAESAVALTPFFLEGMKDEAAFAASRIFVENIQCPLLLISAGDDQMWPSALFAQQIVHRLQDAGSSISCTHFTYPEAGHSISSSKQVSAFHPIANRWFAFGGTARANARAKVDSWKKTLRFFKTALHYDQKT